jgi:hypothetical protein
MSTVLITGCSSGFGLETAKIFLEKGWHVIATMRKPDPSLLPESSNLTLLPLDITSTSSIDNLMQEIKNIDVLVNNAGFGAPVPVELTPLATAQQLMNTNVLGTLSLTQRFLPLMRQQGSGVIINVSSSVTTKAMPLIGLYRASKAALNAWSEVAIGLPGELKFTQLMFSSDRTLDGNTSRKLRIVGTADDGKETFIDDYNLALTRMEVEGSEGQKLFTHVSPGPSRKDPRKKLTTWSVECKFDGE